MAILHQWLFQSTKTSGNCSTETKLYTNENRYLTFYNQQKQVDYDSIIYKVCYKHFMSVH